MTSEDLPSNWSLMPLAQVLRDLPNGRLVEQGWSPQCHGQPALEVGAWGVLKTTSIQPGEFRSEHNKLLPGDLTPKPSLEVLPGDLLLTAAGPQTRCAIPCLVRATRPRLMISGKIYRFRAEESVMDPRFLELFLLSPMAQKSLNAMKTGISDSGLNLTQSRFLGLEVVVPQLKEQRHIVEMLEDHLYRLEVAQASVRTARTRLKALRESWLAEHLGDPPSHEVHRLGDSLLEARGGWSRSRKHLVAASDGVPYLKMNNISRSGTLIVGEVVHVQADEKDLGRYGIRPGDILFNSKNSGDLIGKTAVATETIGGWTFNENIMRLRFDERLEPAFVGLWFMAPRMRRQILRAASASTNVAAVYKHHLIEMSIWIPALARQQRLVDQSGVLAEGSAHLDRELGAADVRSANLRRALLAAAFSGRLTGRVSDMEMVEELVGV